MSMLLAMMLSSITARGIINPIAVAAPAGGDTALYFVLRNSSETEDRLLRVTCACADRVELLRARGGDLGLDTQSVIMPPARLVELRPGGRHMFLVRLRRALIAGETVAMTFHYARGSETRDVRIVAEARTGWAEGLAAMGPRRLASLADLAGWCWRASHRGGRHAGTHCFSPAYGGFMQAWRYAPDAGAANVVWTLFSHDVMARATRYQVTGPDGERGYGRVLSTDGGVTFENYGEQPSAGRRNSTRMHWRRDGPDAWVMVAESRREDIWRELFRQRMTRAAEAQPF